MKISKIVFILFLLFALVSIPAASSFSETGQSEQEITFNFIDVEIPAVVKFISEITGKNFFFDERLKGKITIIAPTKLSIEESFVLFTSILELKGFTIIPAGKKTYKIIRSSRAKQTGQLMTKDKLPVNDAYITRLIPLEHIKANEAVKFLKPTIAGDGYLSSFGPRNLLLVVDSALNIEKIMSILKTIDQQPTYEEPPKVHVYALENADATELAKVMTEIIRGAKSASKKKAGLKSISEITITPDKSTNALIILASQVNYQNIIPVIKELDRRRRQVYVEAMILEVSVDRLKDLGAEWRAAAERGGTPIVIAGFGTISSATLQSITNGLSGFSAGGMGNFLNYPVTTLNSDGTFSQSNMSVPGYAALFSLSVFKNTVDVLSTPQILTSDNEEAEIIVGENVPFISKRERDITTANTVLNSIERKDVGITLRITPQISESDYVKLEIYQEISSVKESTESIMTSVGPTTTKRSAKTTVVVKDGHTVVIGGLMQEKWQEGVAKVPFFGDIPILGWFFKHKSTSRNKVNLIMFLTPHIVKNAEDLNEITTSKYATFTEKTKHYAEGELLVKFKDDVSEEKALEIILDEDASVITFLKDIRVYHIKLEDGRDLEDAVNDFLSIPEIQHAEPKARVSINN